MGLYLNESGVLTPIAGRGDLTAIRSEMSYLGAKNLTPSKEISQTKSGVIFTVDSDGVVTLNGTSNNIIFRSTISNNNAENIKIHLKKGTYTYSLCDTEITGVSLVIKDMGGNDILRTTSIRGANFTLSEDKDVTIDWRVESGVTFSDTEFKAMLRLASDPDDTYQPYAMTNKELTDRVVQSVESITLDNTTTNAGSVRLYRYGNLRVLTGHFRPTVAGTSDANSHIADLPSSADYPQFDVAGICGRGAGSSTAESKVGNILALASGSVVFQGKDVGENMFFNITWVVA